MSELSPDVDLSTLDVKHTSKDQLIALLARMQSAQAVNSKPMESNDAHSVATLQAELTTMKSQVESLTKVIMERLVPMSAAPATAENGGSNSTTPQQSGTSGAYAANISGGERKEHAQQAESGVDNDTTFSPDSTMRTPRMPISRGNAGTNSSYGNNGDSVTQVRIPTHQGTPSSDGGPASGQSSGPNVRGDSPNTAIISIEFKETLPNSKDYHLKLSESGIKPDDFHLWYHRIRDVIEGTTKFRPLINPSLPNSFRDFCLTYSKSVERSQLQSLYLTAHCKLWVFLTECLPTQLRIEMTTRLKSLPTATLTDIPNLLGFEVMNIAQSPEPFYKNCQVLLATLEGRYYSSSVHNRGDLMRQLEKLRCGDHEDPRHFLVKWQNLQSKLTLTVKGYVQPPEEMQIQQLAERLPQRYSMLRTMANDPSNTMTLDRLISWAGNVWLEEKSHNGKGKGHPPGQRGKTPAPEEPANPTFDNKSKSGQKPWDKGNKKWKDRKNQRSQQQQQSDNSQSTAAAAPPKGDSEYVCPVIDEPLGDIDYVGEDEQTQSEHAHILNTISYRPHVNQFIYDTGASVHLTGNPKLLTNVKDSFTPIKVTSIGGIKASRKEGSYQFNDRVKLAQVRIVPGSEISLISAGRLAAAGLVSIVTNLGVYVLPQSAMAELRGIIKRFGTVMHFRKVGQLYVDKPDLAAEGTRFSASDVLIDDAKRPPPAPPARPANRPAQNNSAPAPSTPASKSASASASTPASASAHVSFADSIDDCEDFQEEYAMANSVEEDVRRSARTSDRTAADSEEIKSADTPIIPPVPPSKIDTGTQTSTTDTRSDIATLWHNRLGHGSIESFNATIMHYSLGIEPIENNGECITCTTSKARRAPINRKTPQPVRIATDIMDKWCVDLVGPISEPDPNDKDKRVQIPSIDGHSYVLVMVDEFSRCTMVQPIHHKFDAVETIIKLVKLWQNCTGRKLVRLHSDGGKEFINSGLESFLSDNGTELTTTTPDTPEFNGLVERMNQHLVTMSRCMLNHSNSTPQLWSHAIMYASHIYNNSVQPANGGQIPIMVMDKNRQPTLEHIKVFGSDCHMLVARRGKLAIRTQPAIFIGYSEQYGTNKILYVNNTGKLAVQASRDVKVIESEFNHMNSLKPKIIASAKQAKLKNTEYEVDAIVSHKFDKNGKPLYEVKWKDYPENSFVRASYLNNCSDKLVKYLLSIIQPEPVNVTTEEFSFATQTAYECISNVNEPQSYKEALNHTDSEQWQIAIQSELQSLAQRDVFTPVNLPKGARSIPCRWVFKAKLDSNNNIARYKARLVVKGYLQRPGEDYESTFSPTVGYQSIKLLLQFAAINDWEIKQIDFDTAFLNAILDEDIYVKIPEGYDRTNIGDHNVLKLNRALYGLKQASRAWYLNFVKFIFTLGYVASELDPCLFVKIVGNDRIYITLWVDDILSFFAKLLEEIWLADKEAIAKHYNIKDLGDAQWILNMKLTRDRVKHTITLSQQAYIDRMITDHRMQDCKPAKNPFEYQDLTVPPEKHIAVPLTSFEHEQYRSIVGLLLYASIITRIDISFITSMLARYVSKPMNYHLTAARRVLRYLKGQNDCQLLFGPSNINHSGNESDPFDATIYTDSDWAQQRDDRKSNGGWILMVNGRPIIWQCKKQKTTALSTAEAELYAMVEGVREALYIKQWLEFYMCRDPSLSITVKCDNNGANEMADHKTDHGRTKHIDLRHFFVREHVAKQTIRVIYVPTGDNLADLLTKPVSPQVFVKLRDALLTRDSNPVGADPN